MVGYLSMYDLKIMTETQVLDCALIGVITIISYFMNCK